VESRCSPGYVLCPTSDRGPVEWTTVAAKGAGSPSSAGFSSREKSTADADGGMCDVSKPQRGGGAGSCRGWWKRRPSMGREAYVSIYRALIPVGCPVHSLRVIFSVPRVPSRRMWSREECDALSAESWRSLRPVYERSRRVMVELVWEDEDLTAVRSGGGGTCNVM